MKKHKTFFTFGSFAIALFISLPASAARLSVLFGGSSGSSGGHARMFVTSTTYDGNLGGIAGADAKCQARADAASLGGTWKAIISDSTTSAKSRMKLRLKPVFNLAGELMWNPAVPLMVSNDSVISTVAAPWGSTVSSIANNPEITELGTLVSGTTSVWTGTTRAGLSHSGHCTNWTSNGAVTGIIGSTDVTTVSWIFTTSGNCTSSYRLFCLEDE
ncbi:MAG: DUF1554 domain-containing protein [Bdellovibrio sp.]|nr:DUF1554 domain-containing protein [Bdellovibrio sp.]